jgi:hypothetical protein
LKGRHQRRHARREAVGTGAPIALTAVDLVGDACLQHGLILGSERGLLSEPPGLGRIKPRLTGDAGQADTEPLTREIEILGIVERPGGGQGRRHRRHERQHTDRVAVEHVILPRAAIA